MLVGLVGGIAGLLEPQAVLITSQTPREMISRSFVAALASGVGLGLVIGLGLGFAFGLSAGLATGLVGGIAAGLERGGWFVLLQKVAHRRLARDGNLPFRPYDFLLWGIERQIFRRVGGGVRFRHNLIQQHLANSSEGAS
jgi:hypothetical protein